MEYLAHIADDGREQTVGEHLRSAAEYSSRALAPAGLCEAGYLCALLHDCGKYISMVNLGECCLTDTYIRTVKCAEVPSTILFQAFGSLWIAATMSRLQIHEIFSGSCWHMRSALITANSILPMKTAKTVSFTE